ncbi:MAG: metallophosphoesterase [Nanoarchaeota archaeon]|nr:metallophosphoesterase [DPANN group archaeon]MBL7116734.1 metallophosphoesterase [Nanoarchaeota archaeon]
MKTLKKRNELEILPSSKIIDLSLFLEKERTLILGDIHIGFEEAMHKEGVLLPKFHFKDLTDKLEEILKKTKPKTVIINGDIKHEFGTISDEEWRNTLKLIDLISEKAHLVLVKGNHDTILEPIAKKRDVDIRDYYTTKDIYICHGHKMPQDADFKNSKRVIISHDHPAISLREGPRIEKYKCFLVGKWKDKKLVVLPAFSPTSSGSDIMKEKMFSPLLTNISKFRVIVVEDKVYDFGFVKELEKKIKV